MTAALVAAAVSTLPTPHDYLSARAELVAPADAPPVVTRPTARTHAALIRLMLAEGAMDPEHVPMWFGERPYESEVRLARINWLAVQSCPTLDEGEWVPCMSYLAARAKVWRDAAEQWRGWVEWNPDRADVYAANAAACESVACDLTSLSNPWGPTWAHPRRVMLRGVRAAVGEKGWAARELPAGW